MCVSVCTYLHWFFADIEPKVFRFNVFACKVRVPHPCMTSDVFMTTRSLLKTRAEQHIPDQRKPKPHTHFPPLHPQNKRCFVRVSSQQHKPHCITSSMQIHFCSRDATTHGTRSFKRRMMPLGCWGGEFLWKLWLICGKTLWRENLQRF